MTERRSLIHDTESVRMSESAATAATTQRRVRWKRRRRIAHGRTVTTTNQRAYCRLLPDTTWL